MRIILLGPPGAGKGTMASGIKKRYGIPHISSGDIFREAIRNQSDLGKKVKAIIDAGDLVTDELTVALVKSKIQEEDAQRGFILDGFPRTLPQAEAFNAIAKVDRVLNFSIPHEQIIRRLSGRRLCRSCGKIYHMETQKPRIEGKCDVDGGELYTRPDDMEESIQNRLKVYESQTAPLISYYRSKNIMKDVDAAKDIETVFNEVYSLLD